MLSFYMEMYVSSVFEISFEGLERTGFETINGNTNNHLLPACGVGFNLGKLTSEQKFGVRSFSTRFSNSQSNFSQSLFNGLALFRNFKHCSCKIMEGCGFTVYRKTA